MQKYYQTPVKPSVIEIGIYDVYFFLLGICLGLIEETIFVEVRKRVENFVTLQAQLHNFQDKTKKYLIYAAIFLIAICQLFVNSMIMQLLAGRLYRQSFFWSGVLLPQSLIIRGLVNDIHDELRS